MVVVFFSFYTFCCCLLDCDLRAGGHYLIQREKRSDPSEKTFRIPKIFKRIFSKTNSPGSINPNLNCGRTFG